MVGISLRSYTHGKANLFAIRCYYGKKNRGPIHGMRA